MIQVRITGPKGAGKTTLARVLTTYLRDLGYDIRILDEPHADSLSRTEVLRMVEHNRAFVMPSVEVYANQEEAEVLSNKELTQRLKRVEACLAKPEGT